MSVNPVAQSALSYIGLAQEAQRLRQLAAMLDQSLVQTPPSPAASTSAAPDPAGKGQYVDLRV